VRASTAASGPRSGAAACPSPGPAARILDAEVLPVVHWHQDTFDLPHDASWLARNELFPHQAFRVGERAYGLQFHIEVNRALAEAWREHLPAGVRLLDASLTQIEAVGRGALDAFFDLAAA
jgi:GMP synthase (glutamine-hydrolysing)